MKLLLTAGLALVAISCTSNEHEVKEIDTQIDPDFETEVEAIDDSAACTNASANATGEPAACALHGAIQDAMDTFRTEVVSALSLATPDRAAGDND